MSTPLERALVAASHLHRELIRIGFKDEEFNCWGAFGQYMDTNGAVVCVSCCPERREEMRAKLPPVHGRFSVTLQSWWPLPEIEEPDTTGIPCFEDLDGQVHG